jgi:very-short-patch-repair endonuclease
MIVIEIDWEIHDDRKEYDDERSNVLEWLWLKVIRFTNSDIIDDFEWVCFELDKALK